MIANFRQRKKLFPGKKRAGRLPMPSLIERDKHSVFQRRGKEFLSLAYQTHNCHLSQVAAGFSPTSPQIVGEEESIVFYSDVNFRADHSQRVDRRSKRAAFSMWKPLTGLLPGSTSIY